MSDLRFQDQVTVVTGGASGIGFATARLFASEGAIVAINDVRAEEAEQACESIRNQGGRAFAIPGDVSDLDQVRANVRAVLERHGRIDILVNNAGLFGLGAAESVSPEQWRKLIAVNLDGVFFWAQTVGAQSMIPNRKGIVVNVASPAGLAAIPDNIGYVASKHAVVGVTKSLAVEWGRHNIRVNCLCPGLTESQMVKDFSQKNPTMFADRQSRIPLGRSAQPEEQAHAIAFLASPEATYVHGLIMNVDGGMLSLFSGYSINVSRPAS